MSGFNDDVYQFQIGDRVSYFDDMSQKGTVIGAAQIGSEGLVKIEWDETDDPEYVNDPRIDLFAPIQIVLETRGQ